MSWSDPGRDDVVSTPLERACQRIAGVWSDAWLRTFPSTYGWHSLDEKGHCHTRDSGGYIGRHRAHC